VFINKFAITIGLKFLKNNKKINITNWTKIAT
jgi:hypothetical protein